MKEVIPARLEEPTYESFRLVKGALLGLMDHPFTRHRRANRDGSRIFFSAERYVVEEETLLGQEVSTSYFAMLAGFMTAARSQNKILLRYRELPQNEVFKNSGFVHDYILRTEGHEVVEYGQSIKAIPGDLPVAAINSDDIRHSLWKQHEVEEGQAILRRELGDQLEVREGDMALLLDRIQQY